MKGLKIIAAFIIALLIGFYGCKQKPEISKEEWIGKPVKEWPELALTNNISFNDTTFSNLANSFIVDTGIDTIGVSSKHLFLIFKNQLSLNSIDPGEGFNYWNFNSRKFPGQIIQTKNLINKDSNEPIGEFRTLKDRDWLIFELDKQSLHAYPLKIRYAPIKKGEIIYAVGYSLHDENKKIPQLTKLQCYTSAGTYYYVHTISENTHPEGTSGSPVIDKNGYLVGIVSGAEGNLGIIGGTMYLKKLFDKYQVSYKVDF